ncbi:hypothetical protein GQR58_001873 [Nymphon striatum]|nr:hypothetical protein GQR58_001873 [Nymphon striatum]
MRRDIRNFSKICLECQHSKIGRHTKSVLETFTLPSNRFETVHMDIVAPLPPLEGQTVSTYQMPACYVLTMIDRSTSRIEAAPLISTTAEEVAHVFIANWVSRFDVPLYVITDCGSQFEPKFFREVASAASFHCQRTTAYHPQTNGKVERQHQSIKAILKSQREGENIDEYVTELKMMTPEVRALVLDGNCVIVPVSMRRYMLELIHMSHLGIVKCKRRARELVYWPGMQAQIEDTVSKCSICQANRNMPNKELLKSHEIPYNCWSKVGTDLCTFGGKNYVICIDYFSKFLEYVQLSDETSESVIKAIQLIFSRQGIPKIVMSDNGPCYNSSLFKKFAGEWGFVHKTSSPRHSQSNGQVENGIKTFKKLLKKSGGNHTKFQLALLEFRTSPIDGISKSPSQLLNGRRFKTLLPITESLLKPIHSSPDDHPQLLNRQKRQKYYFGRNRHNLKPLNVNDNLRFRIDNKWVPGTVTQKVDDRSYKMESRNGEIRRNRCQINKSQEEIIVEPNVEIDLNADECVESEQGCESNVKDSKKVTRSDCGYTDPDEMVRDRIAFGTNAAKVREKLINEGSSLTLNKAIEIARVYKILREQLNFMSDKVTDFNSKEVNAVRTTRKIIQEENTRSCVNVVFSMRNLKVQQIIKNVLNVIKTGTLGRYCREI